MSGNEIPAAELEVLGLPETAGNLDCAADPRDHARLPAHGSRVGGHPAHPARGQKLVTRIKGPVGKAFVYSVTETAGKVHRNALHRFLHRVFGGDSMHLVLSSVFETKPPDHKQLKELEQLVVDLKAKSRKM